MKQDDCSVGRNDLKDRIDGNRIVLNADGAFPKTVLIVDRFGKIRQYRIVKTVKGGYILN